MYVPAEFAEPRTEALHALIQQHPLGTLLTYGSNGLDATHLPFELDVSEGGLGVLRAHAARKNPVWQDVGNGEVLVVFQSVDAYISPQWYPSKQETHKEVPTWNYVVAHAYGRLTARDDERYVRGVVARLTRSHEASQSVPWKMGDAPRDYIDTLLTEIVGIEIEITRLLGKSKLSQHKAARDIRGAGEALKEQGKHLIGDAMLAHAEAKENR